MRYKYNPKNDYLSSEKPVFDLSKTIKKSWWRHTAIRLRTTLRTILF